ncbi:MAG TPA: nicotinate phosphoribosyltransferase [Blastocatellia bacterium]|nr:nicotinate phosphoribosyltransferase [Blastocatellia bacterium]
MKSPGGQEECGARSPGLSTDLYELTMAAGYFAEGRRERATFEHFIRRMPGERSYLVAAGIEQALDYLRGLSFTAEEVSYLRALPVLARVPDDFFDYLRDFRFRGEVWAVCEGELVFPGEPLLRVTAPLIEAQIVETFLLATVNFQTLIASKAARIVEAAAGRGVIEFGARRAHGMEAALYAARAAFVGGCVGTSNVEAGRLFGLPLYGTAAHSWTMAFGREIDAFRAYHRVFPESTTLLLDTYDTLAAARLATEVGPGLRGVRLDSGDLGALAAGVRRILDVAGMERTQIVASGDLDEYKIAGLLAAGAPIDLFGVGTELSTSRDAPALGGVYKLVELEVAGRMQPKLKLSEEKGTYPCGKQVWRVIADDDSFVGDVIGLADEGLEGEPLLAPVMRGGELLAPPPPLRATQEEVRRRLARLPAIYKVLRHAPAYPVRYSEGLERRRAEVISDLKSMRV